MTMNGNALIVEYLASLDEAGARLSAKRRAELRDEMRDHIDAALAESGSRDEVAVRNVLDRLGSPEEIVAAELAASGAEASAGAVGGPDSGVAGPAPTSAQAPLTASQGLGAVEIVALLFLTLGSILIPFVGPLLGLLFVWLSDRWSGMEKVVATVIVVVLLALPFALFFGMSAGAEVGAPQTVPAQTAGP